MFLRIFFLIFLDLLINEFKPCIIILERTMMRRSAWFYPGEIAELAVATIVVYLVFLSIAGWRFNPTYLTYVFLLSFLVYIPHELAHKFTAMYYGLPARYKLIKEFFLLTLISAIPFMPIKIIVPGTVLIYMTWPVSKETNGVISAAGPITNLLIGLVALVIGGPFARVLAEISGWIAFFNLIPFGPLDGKKILEWNGLIWLILFAFSAYLAFIA